MNSTKTPTMPLSAVPKNPTLQSPTAAAAFLVVVRAEVVNVINEVLVIVIFVEFMTVVVTVPMDCPVLGPSMLVIVVGSPLGPVVVMTCATGATSVTGWPLALVVTRTPGARNVVSWPFAPVVTIGMGGTMVVS